MKVLISAYACDPAGGSEPGAGWTWAHAAALNHEVWLVTRENNRPAIDALLAQNPWLAVHPHYVDLPPALRCWKRGKRGIRTYYLLWQILVRWHAIRLHRRVGFDVLHHLTFATDWLPCGLSGLARSVPLVWGPVGGATRAPLSMARWLGAKGMVEESIRTVVTTTARRLWGDRTSRRAAVTVAQNFDVSRRFSRQRCVVEPNVAIGHEVRHQDPEATEMKESSPRGPVRSACFVGRLVPLKGLPIALEAIAMSPGWRLDVYGEGPDRMRCEAMVRRLGVGDRVTFHGEVPRRSLDRVYAESDVLLFPSMHDAAGWAIAEAMHFGCRVIALDHGGPAVVAQGDTCHRVAPGPRASRRFAEALRALPATRHAPDTRWSADRLPARLDAIYSLAQRRWHARDKDERTLRVTSSTGSP